MIIPGQFGFNCPSGFREGVNKTHNNLRGRIGRDRMVHVCDKVC